MNGQGACASAVIADPVAAGAPLRIGSVTVCHNADLGALARQWAALVPQVQLALAVDNGSRDAQGLADLARAHGVQLLRLPDNLGIGAAHNAGLAWLAEQACSHALLMDDDSEPAPGMVDALVHALSFDAGAVAAGPMVVDARSGRPALFMAEQAGAPCLWPEPGRMQELPPRDIVFAIASGLLIRLDLLARVGVMRAEYFIDQVDTEWCLRARSLGLRVLGVPGALLRHHLGDRVQRVWLGRWRHVPQHSPLRHYYIARNTLLMVRDLGLRGAWWRYFMGRLPMLAVYFGLGAPERARRLRLMALGLWHGWRDRRGQLDEGTGEVRAIAGLRQAQAERREG